MKSVDNKLDFTGDIIVGLNPIVVLANTTAVNGALYNASASATFTDPTGVEGLGYEVKVLAGTSTIGGVAYAIAGSVINRVFQGGVWASYLIGSGVGSAGLTSFNGRTVAAAMPTAGDYNAFYQLTNKEVGVIYSEAFAVGTVATNYTNAGTTTWTLGAGIITVNNGSAGSGNVLTLNAYKVASDKFQFTVTTKVGDINTHGLMYGIPYFLGNFQFGLDTTVSSASVFKVIHSGADISDRIVGPTLSIAVNVGDLIDIKCTFNVDQVFITATNVTVSTRPTISFKVKLKLGLANSLIGIGKLAIFSMGGANHGFTKFLFRDLNKYNPEYVIIGDSITAGATTYNEEYTYKSNLYNAGVDLVKLACGQANIDDFDIPEFINYLVLINPKKIILPLGSNQVSASGGTVAFTKYQAFITRLNNAGFTDITFCTVLDRNTYTTEINIFNAAIYANLPANKIVHLNSIVGSFSQFDDGIHPGAAINELMSDAILQHLNISKDYSKNKNNEIRTQIPLKIIKGSQSGISPMGTADKSFVGSSTFAQFNYRGPAMIFNNINNAVELITYNNIAGTTMSGVTRAQYGTVALASTNAGVYSVLDLETKTDNTIPYHMTFANPNGFVSQIYNRNGPLQLNDIYGWHLTDNTSARISGSGNVYFKITKPSGSFQSVLEFSTYNGNNSFGGSFYQIINDSANNFTLINSGTKAWEVNTANQFGLGRAPLAGFLTVQHGTTTSAPIVMTPSLTLVTTSASGTGSVATIGFATQLSPPFYVGQMITVLGITPTGYNATVAVTACTTNSVSYLRSTTGAQTVAGTVAAGALATTPISGALEFDGTRFYQTPFSLTRQTVAWLSDIAAQKVIKGTFTATGTATSTFTVTIPTQLNNTYVVTPVAQNAVSAASFYVTNQTTTTYDIVTLTALTGAVAFGWVLVP